MDAFTRLIAPYLLITLSVWVTYLYTLRCGFVSDDIDGIGNYDGKLQGFEYGMISRWVRYHLCGGNFLSKHKFLDQTGKEVAVPQGKVPVWHHVLSVSVFNVACLLLYTFLSDKFSPTFGLLTVLLFTVHPICTQAVAWCSGLGYPLSLVWMGVILNLVPWIYAHPTIENVLIGTLAFCVFQFLAIHAQFATMMLWAVLAFFGYYHFAVLGLLISVAMGFDIIRQTIKLRVDEFKKQNMGKSTKLNLRKIVVACKTFMYYMAHCLIPARIGLYHSWGFHYGNDLERRDKRFVVGLTGIIGVIVIFLYAPSIEIKLGILWFVGFIGIFLNWITIQQFVTERYAFIPTIGVCLILTYLTQNHLWIYTFIFGAYLVRTWMVLPTYDNELRFYESNTWNFPESEVAYGNLGVTQLRIGLIGSSLDSWHKAIRINPDYDVPYYNIFSHYRSNGDMALRNGDYNGAINLYSNALPYLEKTLSCKVCHFPEMWKAEHMDLANRIKNPSQMLLAERARLKALETELKDRLSKMTINDDVRPVQSSINDAQAQVARLEKFMAQIGIVFEAPKT